MKILIVGAGATGLLYGGWLAKGGADITFLARPQAVSALTSGPIYLSGPTLDEEIDSFSVVSRAAPRAFDVLIYTVKHYDLHAAAVATAAALKDGGCVLGLQNGVTTHDVLTRTYHPDAVAVGVVYAAAMRASPSRVAHSGKTNLVAFGTYGAPISPILADLAAIWKKAGVEARVEFDIRTALWTKFLGFATNAALTCLARQPAGIVYADEHLLEVTRKAIEEAVAVGKAEGALFADDAGERTLRLLQSFPKDMVASMRQDLDAGRPLELENVSGEICRLGRKHGIPTPIHEIAYACLKPFANGHGTEKL